MDNLRELYQVTVIMWEKHKTPRSKYEDYMSPLNSGSFGGNENVQRIKNLLENRFSFTFDHDPTSQEIEKSIRELRGNILESNQISVKVDKYFLNY